MESSKSKPRMLAVSFSDQMAQFGVVAAPPVEMPLQECHCKKQAYQIFNIYQEERSIRWRLILTGACLPGEMELRASLEVEFFFPQQCRQRS